MEKKNQSTPPPPPLSDILGAGAWHYSILSPLTKHHGATPGFASPSGWQKYNKHVRTDLMKTPVIYM